eukprot:scaffold468709_cov17-Prasinocladus_malaysianus.AAC.1
MSETLNSDFLPCGTGYGDTFRLLTSRLANSSRTSTQTRIEKSTRIRTVTRGCCALMLVLLGTSTRHLSRRKQGRKFRQGGFVPSTR